MSQERLKPSVDADLLSTLGLVELIQAQDITVADAVARQAPAIAKAIDAVAERLGRGGRLYYIGAGTSGRIALLDAVELPPTYGVEPDLVQVIVAGGPRALVSAVEGAEDDERDGAEQVEHRGGRCHGCSCRNRRVRARLRSPSRPYVERENWARSPSG
jgi:N-acetylmuramic acid 6-phosphate etherase